MKPLATATTAIIITMRMTDISTRTLDSLEQRLAEPASPPERGGSRERSALPLLAWLSPQFPVGSFAYSHGIEWAVEAGDVQNADSASDWIAALLAYGALRNDLILAACAHRAVVENNDAQLCSLAELALALAGSRERRLETSAQGNAFRTAISAAWTTPDVERIFAALGDRDVAYPIAIGSTCGAYGVAREAMLEGYALAMVQNLVSAVIRLSVVGQSNGQRIISGLMATAQRGAAEAHDASLDDLGSAAFNSDIASIRHETQRTRLFRS